MTRHRGWVAALLVVLLSGCGSGDDRPSDERTLGAHVFDSDFPPRDASGEEFCALQHAGDREAGTAAAARAHGLDLQHLGTPASFSDSARRGWQGDVAYWLRLDEEDADETNLRGTAPPVFPDTDDADVAAYFQALLDTCPGLFAAPSG